MNFPASDLETESDLGTADPANSLIQFTADEHPRERRRALDGLRAIAVGAVIAFHAGLPHAHGGFLGVDIFFVLSGFLITSLLINEYDVRSKIGLGRFYSRRAKRLFPALALVSVAIVVMANIITPSGLYPNLRGDVVAALFYFSNWHLIVHSHGSYFTLVPAATPFTHTWSLAIEEQFYILWPLIIILLFKWRRSLKILGTLAFGAAIASSLFMAFGAQSHWNVDRLYFGTDTHAMGLLLGAATSCLLYEAAKTSARSGALTHLEGFLRTAGPIGGVVTLAIMALAFGSSRWLFYVGFFVLSISTSAFIAYLVMLPHSVAGRALALTPLVYIGQISYGLYLWHFPIFQWVQSYWTGLAPPALFVVRLSLTFVAAIVSFHFIEMPIRRHHFNFNVRTAIGVTLCGALVLVFCFVGATRAQQQPAFASTPPALSGTKATVLILGDSVAFTLALPLSTFAPHYGINIKSGAILGCGLISSTAGLDHQIVSTRSHKCLIAPNGSSRLASIWHATITKVQPREIVVLAGRWEEKDLLFGTQWRSISDPRFRAAILVAMNQIAANAALVHAHLVFLTMPCSWNGERPGGSQWVENLPSRNIAYNDLITRGAAKVHATVINLSKMSCPTGKLQYDIDGIRVRNSDGVHFAISSAPYLAPRLLPQLARIARSP